MSSAVRETLEGYVAGRVQAERVVAAVAAAYYGAGVRGKREGLRPLVDVIERAAPGVIELSSARDSPGFAITLVERRFPSQYEVELRRAAAAVLAATAPLHHAAPPDHPGWISRIVRAVRRLFRGSA